MRLNVSPTCATHVEEVNNYTHGINTSDSVFILCSVDEGS